MKLFKVQGFLNQNQIKNQQKYIDSFTITKTKLDNILDFKKLFLNLRKKKLSNVSFIFLFIYFVPCCAS